MPPPSPGALPSQMVRPEIETVTLLEILKTRLAWLPLTTRFVAPGPTMVRLLSRTNSPVVRIMVPLVANSIVSPLKACPIVCRNEPGPSSARVVTTPPFALILANSIATHRRQI